MTLVVLVYIQIKISTTEQLPRGISSDTNTVNGPAVMLDLVTVLGGVS